MTTNNHFPSHILEQAIYQAFSAVVITDDGLGDDGHVIVYANPAFCKMTGYTLEELLGKNPRMLQGELTDQDVITKMRQSLQDGAFFEDSTINYRKDGQPYEVSWNISPVYSEDGCISHFVSVMQDVTVLNSSIRKAKLFKNALNANQDAVMITDKEGQIEYCNNSFEIMTGYFSENIIGTTPNFLKSGLHDNEYYHDMWQTLSKGQSFQATFINRTQDGKIIYCDESITPLLNDNNEIQNYVSIFRDVTQREMHNRRYRDMVKYDSLTGALLRAAGEMILEEAFQRTQNRKDFECTVAFVDIDFFKAVNDTYGHGVGDQVLQLVSHCLSSTLRENDHLIRWGGEEFLLVFNRCNITNGLLLAERCRKGIEQLKFDKLSGVTISIGVAQLKEGESLINLIQRADQSLYKAKVNGRNMVSTC
jgi:diguanylate cyclase (GGDEF)-like protein/PAS domain S-box-containing protein